MTARRARTSPRTEGRSRSISETAVVMRVSYGLAAAQGELKGHGASIQELTVRVTALAGAASAAVAANRLGAAFRLNEQLESALGRLDDRVNHAVTRRLFSAHVAVLWA